MQAVANAELEPKDYSTIGKLLAKEDYPRALSLVQGYRASQSRALDSDTGRIFHYYVDFCKLNSVYPDAYMGSLHDSERISKRDLFIGTMVRVFMPQLLTHDLDYRTGFALMLRGALDYDPGNLSKSIERVVSWMKNNTYGFMDSVQETAEQLISRKNGFAANLFDNAA